MSLIKAVKNGDINKVRELLATDGADVYETEHGGWTSLMYAAYRSHKEIVELLLEHDNSSEHINRQDNNDWTALIYASSYGHKEIVEILLEYDNSSKHIDLQDIMGYTALMYCSHFGHEEIVGLLLKHDADLNIWNDEDESAVDLAKTEEIKELLLNWEPKGAKKAKGV